MMFEASYSICRFQAVLFYIPDFIFLLPKEIGLGVALLTFHPLTADCGDLEITFPIPRLEEHLARSAIPS